MIKKWNQFNESKAEKPGESIPGSAKINLSPEDVNAFTDNQSLQKLISDDKVALLGTEAWYWEDDMTTKGILDQYLEIPGVVEEEPISESVKDKSILKSDIIKNINKLKSFGTNVECVGFDDAKKRIIKLIKES
jgi:hypothetical protein